MLLRPLFSPDFPEGSQGICTLISELELLRSEVSSRQLMDALHVLLIENGPLIPGALPATYLSLLNWSW